MGRLDKYINVKIIMIFMFANLLTNQSLACQIHIEFNPAIPVDVNFGDTPDDVRQKMKIDPEQDECSLITTECEIHFIPEEFMKSRIRLPIHGVSFYFTDNKLTNIATFLLKGPLGDSFNDRATERMFYSNIQLALFELYGSPSLPSKFKGIVIWETSKNAIILIRGGRGTDNIATAIIDVKPIDARQQYGLQ